jgi:simple sugar transport system permease protein
MSETTEAAVERIDPPRPPDEGRLSGEGPATPTFLRRSLVLVLLYAVSIGVAFALSAVLVAVTHGSPRGVFTAMYNGSVNGGAPFGLTLDEAAPLLIVAVGTIIATRAGIFNIGQEGQLIIGAMVGAWVGLHLSGPGPLVLVATLLASAAGGALWAGIAALLRFWRGVDVVISTLLLIFVAAEVVSLAVNRTWILRETSKAGEITAPQSDQLPARVRLPRVGEYPHLNFGTGVFVAVGVAAVFVVLLRRSRWGFRLRLLGLNPIAARRAGVSPARLGGTALVLSGALAGLAGGVMLTGNVFRIQAGFSNNVGFDGLLLALVARGNALIAIPVSLFFGALRAGGGFLASTGVPRYLVEIVQALLVLATVFPPVFLEARRRRFRFPLSAPGRFPRRASGETP